MMLLRKHRQDQHEAVEGHHSCEGTGRTIRNMEAVREDQAGTRTPSKMFSSQGG